MNKTHTKKDSHSVKSHFGILSGRNSDKLHRMLRIWIHLYLVILGKFERILFETCNIIVMSTIFMLIGLYFYLSFLKRSKRIYNSIYIKEKTIFLIKVKTYFSFFLKMYFSTLFMIKKLMARLTVHIYFVWMVIIIVILAIVMITVILAVVIIIVILVINQGISV